MPPSLSGGHEILATDDTTEPSPRSFGVTFAVACAAYGLWPLWRSLPVRVWPVAAATALLVAAVVRPQVLAVPSRAWQKVGLVLHRVVNPIVMGVIFYGAVTPFAALWRWRNPAQAARFRPDGSAPTYWIPRQDPAGSMRRQF